MVTHVVMWTVREEERADGHATAAALKSRIEDMLGKVPHFFSLEVGLNTNASEAAYDVVLISRHTSMKQLSEYQNDPVHTEIAEWVKAHTTTRAVVDFES